MAATQDLSTVPTREPAYRWVIVAAGGFLGCLAMGAMFSLPVFLVPIVLATGWSRAGASAAMTIGFLALAISAMGWGLLVDRIGPRAVVLTGTVLIGLGLAIASQAPNLLVFQAAFGLLTGVGAAAIIPPLMATVTGWFETRRSLAVSLVSAGMGMAPMTMSPFAAWLAARMDWRDAMLAIAGFVVALMIPTAFLLRRPPGLAHAPQGLAAEPANAPSAGVGAALRSPPFLILAATNFLCCATHSGPIFHTVSYAISCGVPAMAAVSIYSLEGLAGMGGRLGFGLLGDRFGAKRVLVAGLLVQAVGALAYTAVRDVDGFYVVAAIFGFTYSGVMPLYSVLARENFPIRMMGAIVGGTSAAGSLGMALGPVGGGWLYDSFATYSWLYVGSAGVGLLAAMMAATFRSARAVRRPVALA